MWLAPRLASELRGRLTDSAKSLGEQASEQYQQVSTHVGEAANTLTRRGQGVRDDVAEAVARGAHGLEHYAHEVERYATAAKSDSCTEARKQSASDRTVSKAHSG
jgi:gas vesicle protein